MLEGEKINEEVVLYDRKEIEKIYEKLEKYCELKRQHIGCVVVIIVVWIVILQYLQLY